MNTILEHIALWTTAQTPKTSGRGNRADNQQLLGIQKLRELILELAVRGKLVPQDPNDEPASILLKKIEAEKKQKVKEGKFKVTKPLHEIKNDKIPFQLPEGWKWAWFSDLYFFQEGPGIRNWQFRNDGIKLLNVQNIVNGKLVLEKSDKYIDPDEYEQKYLHFTIEENDLVFASSGGSWGKTAFFNDPGYKVIVNTSTIRLKPHHEDCSRLFMRNIIDSNLFKNQMIEQLVGMQPNFGSTHLQKVIIPVPPINEQRRIADKVDELMALCDQLEQQQTENNQLHQTLVETLLANLTQAASPAEQQEAWQRIANHFDALFTTEYSIDQLKQTILQLAVMGKLVPQDPTDDPASELLKKIAKEKARLIKEGQIKKQAPLPEITEDEKPFELPEGWEWVAWGNLLAYDDGAFKRGPFGSSLKKDMFVDSGYKVYEQYCPINDDCSFERYYITNEMYEKLKTFAVKANDYLVSCSGATLGRITQVPEDFKEGIINQALLRVRINHEYLDKAFFKLLFRSPFFQKMILDNSTGSAIPNVKGVNELKSMPIPFFPINEQRRIVAKVDELVALCDALKEQLAQAQTTQNLLAGAVVERALVAKPEGKVVYATNEVVNLAAEPE